MAEAAVILAAGSGTRMQGAVTDKLLVSLGGRPVLFHSLAAFQAADGFDTYVIVCRDREQLARIRELSTSAFPELEPAIQWVLGGRERADSVRAGLAALDPAIRSVYIHDGARPLIRPEWIRALRAILETGESAALARPVSDTVKRAAQDDPTAGATSLQDLARDRLWAMETPQAFPYAAILDAYQAALHTRIPLTDDTAAASHAGIPVRLVEPDGPNPKLTTPADLEWAEHLIRRGHLPTQHER